MEKTIKMNGKYIRIGLNVPVFIASLTSLAIGIGLGLVGVWMFGVVKLPVPQMLKVMHAHTSWWAVVILIFALLLPFLPIRKFAKTIIVLFSFLFVPLYVVLLFLHHGLPLPIPIFAGLAVGLEIVFSAIILMIGITAAGIKILFISADENGPQYRSKYDILSDILIPSKVVVAFSAFLLISIILGGYILFSFVAVGKPIYPAALVQFHTHLGFFSIGFLMAFLAVAALGAGEKFNKSGFRIGLVALVGTFLGFLIFNIGKTHSLVWGAPALVYYIFLVFGLACIIGAKTAIAQKPYLPFVQGTVIFIFSVLLLLAAVGPYIALTYNTHPNVTVTYKQPPGMPYPGPYPEEYIGTAPAKHTPRGLELLHLSAGSWSHVATFWLIVLIVGGAQIFKVINLPNLIFLSSVLIVIAPVLNAIARIAIYDAWPGGPGPLLLAAHPLKVINILLLLIVSIVYITILGRRSEITPVKSN